MFVFSRFQAIPKIFSSGLDITEMCGKSMEHYAEFWRAVQEMWLQLYGSNMVTVAAVNVRLLDPPSYLLRAVCHLLRLVCTTWAGTAKKSGLSVLKQVQGCICCHVWVKLVSIGSVCWGVGRYGRVGCCRLHVSLQVLLRYSSVSAAVESLHGTRVLPMGTDVPLAVFCAAGARPCPKNSTGSVLQAGGGPGGGL